MEVKEEYVICTLRLKQAVQVSSYGYNNYAARQQAQNEQFEKLTKNYYFMVNAVIDLGGVIIIDKNSLEQEYKIVTPLLTIKAPKSAIEKLSKHPLIESHTLH